jgi:hypothetical protein
MGLSCLLGILLTSIHNETLALLIAYSSLYAPTRVLHGFTLVPALLGSLYWVALRGCEKTFQLLFKTGVGVEKLRPAKIVKMKLRQDAL